MNKGVFEMAHSAPIPAETFATTVLFGQIDLIIDIDAKKTSCTKLVFSVELKVKDAVLAPQLTAKASFGPIFKTNVDVVVFDDCGNIQLMVIQFTGTGKQTLSVELSKTQCNPPGGDWTRTYFVAADPSNKIAETKEGNNLAKFSAHCIG
jgi:hypothetical protein